MSGLPDDGYSIETRLKKAESNADYWKEEYKSKENEALLVLIIGSGLILTIGLALSLVIYVHGIMWG